MEYVCADIPGVLALFSGVLFKGEIRAVRHRALE